MHEISEQCETAEPGQAGIERKKWMKRKKRMSNMGWGSASATQHVDIIMCKSLSILIFNDPVCICRRHPFIMMLLVSKIIPQLWICHFVSHIKPENYTYKTCRMKHTGETQTQAAAFAT